MGKNQTHKQMQRGRHGGEEGGPQLDAGDGLTDVTFHSPEWHAARLAALTTERMTWEDWKKKQKEDAALGENEEKQMREYRAQLDADRAGKLARGTNNVHLREALAEGKDKDKDRDKDKKSKKRKRKDQKEKDRKRKSKDKDKEKDKKRKRSKDSKKSKKRKSSSSGSSSDSSSSDDEQPASKKSSNPVRLSEFLQS